MSNTAAPCNALPAGTQVGQFVIRQALGAGGFGITYIAYDALLNRDIVIKENSPSFYAERKQRSLPVCPSSTNNKELLRNPLLALPMRLKCSQHSSTLTLLKSFLFLMPTARYSFPCPTTEEARLLNSSTHSSNPTFL